MSGSIVNRLLGPVLQRFRDGAPHSAADCITALAEGPGLVDQTDIAARDQQDALVHCGQLT